MGDAVNWWEFPGATPTDKHAAYLSWHDAVCLTEGIPKPGRNQADDTVELADCWTDSYANALELADGRLVVELADDDPYTTELEPTTVNTGDGPFDPGDLADAVTITDAQSIVRVWGNDPVPRTADNHA